jgi:hypothetical protein
VHEIVNDRQTRQETIRWPVTLGNEALIDDLDPGVPEQPVVLITACTATY